MRIVCVYGASDRGKTSVLLALKNLDGVSEIKCKNSKVYDLDIAGLFEYQKDDRTYHFILSTGGDNSVAQDYAFAIYEEVKDSYDIDAIVVAGRTKGETSDNICTKATAFNVPVIFYEKAYIYPWYVVDLGKTKKEIEDFYSILNKQEAQSILDNIICWL